MIADTTSMLQSNANIFENRRNDCPLCSSHIIYPAHTIKRWSIPFTVDRCADCGFMFMNPRFRDEFIQSFYTKEYFTGNAEYSYCDERSKERYFQHVWEARLNIIRKYIRGGNLLDIGCAFGGFLGAASKYFEVAGIEPSEYAGLYAKKKFGNRIHHGTLENHSFPHDSFLVITMIEVLEHLPNPVFAIKECYRLLQKGGLLVIQTANMEGLQAKLLGERYAYYMPGHLSYFPKRTLANLLSAVGFTRIKTFHPVEFGLWPKLRKSQGDFKSFLDYRKWMRIAAYHYISKIHFGNFCTTSSMVMYAFK
ncbi:MAG: class I SAM-dependent methyltransferase [Spirochaetes bacterium]|nr:class I SAM-dependent methyltransferase [Spirochaetota bacterium]